MRIRNVPDDVIRVLRRRATDAGQSLQDYLLNRLIAEAAHPTLDKMLDRVEARARGHVSFAFAAEALREDRERR